MDCLSGEYFETRQDSRDICGPLEIEDHVVQPWEEVSPPKWHLAHTTWFYEKFILSAKLKGYQPFHEDYNYLFNSYYKTVGKHWLRQRRGALSRPTVREIIAYRDHVDDAMASGFERGLLKDPEAYDLLEVGIQHEKQHQELLLMDIKAILSHDPNRSAYADGKLSRSVPQALSWFELPGGVLEFGAGERGFSYDNERPRHLRFVEPALVSSLITNRDYQDFIDDGGYTRPELWLSLGWDWIQGQAIESPLYWRKDGRGETEFTLYGEDEIDPYSPVQHISYYEADAFARWAGYRLPTEFELENLSLYHPRTPSRKHLHAFERDATLNSLWCWSKDQYQAYPGYQSYVGSLGEYNQKFMCNQFVLRGGCYATPKNHLRATYRNFYEPWQRWMFSGLRLAKSPH